MATEIFPPWGNLDAETLYEIREHRIPADWLPADGSPPTTENWAAFIEDVLTVIGAVLWPRYQAGVSSWDTNTIRELFRVDFELMESLALQFEKPITSLFATSVTHSQLFLDEDNDDEFGLGVGYERYDPTLPVARQGLVELLRKGVARKAGTTSHQLKQELQRPRAYQVALLLNRPFVHHFAATASTPSMISGHCLQGVMAACNAYSALKSQMSTGSIRVMGHFCVDIGDRRVMAGVHYPSDNLSSWYTALRLLPQVFAKGEADDVKKFLWDAISTKSVVYAAIADHVRAHAAQSPYFKANREIEGLVG
jgi:hypothetical protein